MLNYEITRSPAHRGHQRRVITDSNSESLLPPFTSRVLDFTTMNKINLTRAISRKVRRINEQNLKFFKRSLRKFMCSTRALILIILILILLLY